MRKINGRYSNRMGDLFRRKIIFTVPPWGVPIIAGAILFGLVKTPMLVNSVVAFVLSCTALGLIVVARRQVRELRYAVHSALNDIENEDIESESVQSYLTDIPEIEKVNGNTPDILRVPKRR